MHELWIEKIDYGKFICMNKSQKKRLCWNCEGSVAVSEETCPFCGVSVIPAFLEGASVEFAPPYSSHDEKDLAVPKSPFAGHEEFEEVDDHEPEVAKKASEGDVNVDEFKRVAIAVTLLLSGSVFFLFSLALGLFSNNNGLLTLQWDGSYWYLYTVLALPLLLLGWRSLMKLDSV